MKHISQDEIEHLHGLAHRAPEEALKLLRIYGKEYADDPNFLLNSGGLFIDIGSALRNSSLVNNGIKLIEKTLANSSERQTRAVLLYNLGNGYSELHTIRKGAPDFSFDPDSTPLVQAKARYREALELSDSLDSGTAVELFINYANCLSGLGRSVEAIFAYKKALAYEPDHPMAWGNLGVELEYFAFVAGNPAILVDAHEALVRALDGKHAQRIASPHARIHFEEALQRIEQQLNRISVGDRRLHRPEFQRPHSAHYEAYVEFCLKHGLFLNFCLDNPVCARRLGDSVTISPITEIDDEATFPRLARVVNEIKERYAAARLLVFEACDHPYAVDPYDEITGYLGNLDYAVYGTRSAKLKIAFETTYNVLDKIAFFVNDYLALGIREREVSFSSIWRVRGAGHLRPAILQLGNPHLFGLYDISRDFEPEGSLRQLKVIRNLLAHRYLVLHIEGVHWTTEADSQKYHLGYREFFERTIELLQVVRSAVIYLIAFIDQEEQKKRPNERFLGTLLVPRYRYLFTGPLDSPI